MITVAQLKKLLEGRPDEQPVLIQLNDSNGFSVEDVSKTSEKALWLQVDGKPVREMQLYLEVELPDYLRGQ